MPRKPRIDSYKYLYRDLPKSRKQVKVLIAYLEENQGGIKFWSKDSQVLIERAKYGPPVTADDIPETVEHEYRQNIADLLNDILSYYVDLRQKRAERKAELEELRQQIPQDERDKLYYFRDKLTGFFMWRYGFTQDEYQYTKFAELGTINTVNEWLNKTTEEKAVVVEALQKIIDKYIPQEKKHKEKEKREEEEFSWRMWEEIYCRRFWQNSFGQSIGITAFDLITARLTLGVDDTASKDEIKTAWRRRVKQTHPDAGGDTQEFQKVQEAYKVLFGY